MAPKKCEQQPQNYKFKNQIFSKKMFWMKHANTYDTERE